MAMLIANGFTIPAAMKLATPLAIRADLQEAMKRATELVETGSMTSVAWQQSGLAQSFAARVLQAGERTGDLAACFESLAQTYRIQVQTKLERASRLAEPILLVVVACLIGTIVVLMYLPIVDLATAAG
jgi:general secretion pathway protein F